MPPVSRLLIRTGVAYLLLALTAGVVLALPGVVSPGLQRGLAPAVVHLLAVGWLTQLIFGVAIWMFPRPPGHRSVRDLTADRVAWTGLNAGLLLRVAAEPLSGGAAGGTGPVAWALLVAALLQWASILYFAGRLWPRVRSR